MKTLLFMTWLLIGIGGYYGYNFYETTIANNQAITQGQAQALGIAQSSASSLTVQVTQLKEQVTELQSKLESAKKTEAELRVIGNIPTPTIPSASPAASDQTNSIPTAIPSTITTLSGKTYIGCILSQVWPDGISFTHSMGVAKILFSDLDPAFATTFGYDPIAAHKFEVEQAEKGAKIDREIAAASIRQQEADAANEAQIAAAAQAEKQQDAANLAAGVHANAVAAAQDDLNSMLHPAVGGPRISLNQYGQYVGDSGEAARANQDMATINGR